MIEWLNLLPQRRPSLSLYLPPGAPASDLEKTLAEAVPLVDLPPELPELVVRSGTGAALFWGDEQRTLVLPPFPAGLAATFAGCETGPLRALLERDLLLGFVLVRLGFYAVGAFRGEALLSSKVGTGLVHGRHKKGGSSAARFRRHREKQAEGLFTRVCLHAREHLEPHLKSLDYLFYGGERFTVLDLRKQCPFLAGFDERVSPRLLDIRRPNQAGLEEAVFDACSSTVVEWIVE